MERMWLGVFHSWLSYKHLGWLWASHLIIKIILTTDLIAWVLNILFHSVLASTLWCPYHSDNTSDCKISLSKIALLYPHCPSILYVVSPPQLFPQECPCLDDLLNCPHVMRNLIVTIEQVVEPDLIQGCWWPKPIYITLCVPSG